VQNQIIAGPRAHDGGDRVGAAGPPTENRK